MRQHFLAGCCRAFTSGGCVLHKDVKHVPIWGVDRGSGKGLKAGGIRHACLALHRMPFSRSALWFFCFCPQPCLNHLRLRVRYVRSKCEALTNRSENDIGPFFLECGNQLLFARHPTLRQDVALTWFGIRLNPESLASVYLENTKIGFLFVRLFPSWP